MREPKWLRGATRWARFVALVAKAIWQLLTLWLAIQTILAGNSQATTSQHPAPVMRAMDIDVTARHGL